MAAPLCMPCRGAETLVEHPKGEPIWVSSNAELAEAAKTFGPVIAVDTEFIRTDTFFPIASLYQVATTDRIYLIDPLSIDEWQPLQAVIEDRHCVKVMHSCSEDLEVFYSHLGLLPQNLHDSQLAHAFLTTDYSLSYARLVEHYENVALDKGATRSNWLQRPLSAEQIHYAAEDVRYLVRIYEQQLASLERSGRLPWFQEDLAIACRYEPPYPERYYLGMKSAWRLQDEALARLRSLASWREREAMALDLPRNRVIRDEHLLTLAGKQAVSSGDLAELLPAGVVRRFGAAVMGAWALTDAPAEPLERPSAPLSTAQGKVVTRLRELAKQHAQAMGVAPELVGRKRDVESAVRAHLDGDGLGRFAEGWRGQLLGAEFRSLLEPRREEVP
ncbi:MAG: ribonuclease D [Pseudomonadales bacterium]